MSQERDGAILRIALTGDLDLCVAEAVVVFAAKSAVVPGVRALELDLRAVSFLDAAGVRALLGVQAAVGRRRIACRITGAHGIVARVLRISGVQAAPPGCPPAQRPPAPRPSRRARRHALKPRR
ncbi:STAS domain-containing protein [Actinoplanes sp. KI2]|uniref:STAS domain-containing protein n=1 Tax=Actinoplanes sp. KI2 TaxID=2983315 RepID=UPI003982F8C6